MPRILDSKRNPLGEFSVAIDDSTGQVWASYDSQPNYSATPYANAAEAYAAHVGSADISHSAWNICYTLETEGLV